MIAPSSFIALLEIDCASKNQTSEPATPPIRICDPFFFAR